MITASDIVYLSKEMAYYRIVIKYSAGKSKKGYYSFL
jgi:hypothetical protein